MTYWCYEKFYWLVTYLLVGSSLPPPPPWLTFRNNAIRLQHLFLSFRVHPHFCQIILISGFAFVNQVGLPNIMSYSSGYKIWTFQLKWVTSHQNWFMWYPLSLSHLSYNSSELEKWASECECWFVNHKHKQNICSFVNDFDKHCQF